MAGPQADNEARCGLSGVFSSRCPIWTGCRRVSCAEILFDTPLGSVIARPRTRFRSREKLAKIAAGLRLRIRDLVDDLWFTVGTANLSLIGGLSKSPSSPASAAFTNMVFRVGSVPYLPIIETWNLPHSVTVHDEHSKGAGSVSNELGISLANLGRLGCLSPGMGWGGVALFNLMTVTHLGRSLYLACS